MNLYRFANSSMRHWYVRLGLFVACIGCAILLIMPTVFSDPTYDLNLCEAVKHVAAGKALLQQYTLLAALLIGQRLVFPHVVVPAVAAGTIGSLVQKTWGWVSKRLNHRLEYPVNVQKIESAGYIAVCGLLLYTWFYACFWWGSALSPLDLIKYLN